MSTSSGRKLLRCVDTIWPDVIHVETVGMGFHSARTTKNLESRVMSMGEVGKIYFPKNLGVLARLIPNHKTNILYVSFLPASRPCVHVVELLQRRHAHIFEHFIALCISVRFV